MSGLPQQQTRIGAIAIVGGTHGNEFTGKYLVEQWRQKPLTEIYPEFQIECLLANPAAIAANRRYLDKDLNRCFRLEELTSAAADNREQLLAKQLNAELGPKGESRVDFIVDLHTSTANMRTNIVLIKTDPFHLQIAAYIQSQLPDVVITSESDLMADHHFLCSIAERGILIEVGPIAQGVIDAEIYQKTEKALEAALSFCQLQQNRELLPGLPEQLTIMSYFDKLYFPTDAAGNLLAAVHPRWIGNDFALIRKGDPVFRRFNGEDILYQGEDAYVAFVNEAAYYDQAIALCLCRPQNWSLKSFKPLVESLAGIEDTP